MGSSVRHSQDAEGDSGEEYDSTEGGGDELESSHRPGGGDDERTSFGSANKDGRLSSLDISITSRRRTSQQ